MASDSSNVDAPSPEEEVIGKKKVKCFRLFNCDQTYKFDAVEKLLEVIKAKLSFEISIQKHYFDLRNMSEVCDGINKKELQMDFAIFVVHAHESRLSINEENAGIGYAKLYRALLQATEERVLIVIGGDDNYKDTAKEQSTVLSRWARRKVSSQFNEEFLDGRKSFIFSWNKEHRPIHEEAMLHFFDPDKKGEKFVPKPIVEATVAPENTKTKVESQERGETDVKSTKTKQNSSNIQTQTSYSAAQKAQTSIEQDTTSPLNPLQKDDTDTDGFEIISSSQEEHGTEENMDKSEHTETSEHMEMSDETYEELSLEDVPKEGTSTQPDTGSSSLPKKIAILYRDESDIAIVKDVFGDVFGDVLQAAIITSSDPSAKKESSTQVESPMTPEELVLHTRLRKGTISYEKDDVKLRLNGWTAPQEMADNLFQNNQNIANAEVLVYRETETGNERTVVNKDITSKLSGLGQGVKGAVDSVVGTSVVQTGVAGVYGIGSTIGSTIRSSSIWSTIAGLCGSSNTPPSNSDTPSSKDESNDLQLD